MNAVIYARFSSYNQQEQSIEGQLRACREYAARNDLTIVAEYCDRARSGTNSNRPEFQRMLKDSETGGFKIVLVYQYDRFARNRRESMNNEFLLQANGVKLVSINEPIDEEDSTSVIVKGMFESIAEYYSRDLSKKVKRGMKESIIQRKSIGGIRWLGYKTNSEMKIYIDEEEAAIVHQIFEMRIAGSKVDEIVAYLNNHGYKNKDAKFNSLSVRKILSNEKYTGRYQNPYNPSEIITDMFPAIISKKEFDAVQETFVKYRYNSCKGTKNPTNYYLSGKLFSSIDGTPFTGSSGYSSTGKKYGYYKARVTDTVYSYAQKELEDEIISAVKNIVSTNTYMEYLAEKMLAEFKRRSKSEKGNSIAKKKAEIQKKIDKIGDAFIDADKEMRVVLNKKLQDLRIELDSLEKESEYYDQEKLKLLSNVDLIKQFIKQFINKDLEDPTNRKLFFKVLLNSAFIYKNHIDFYLNFDVAEQITFDEYKNDVLQLENVRFSNLLAVEERPYANFYIKNWTVLISISI